MKLSPLVEEYESSGWGKRIIWLDIFEAHTPVGWNTLRLFWRFEYSKDSKNVREISIDMLLNFAWKHWSILQKKQKRESWGQNQRFPIQMKCELRKLGPQPKVPRLTYSTHKCTNIKIEVWKYLLKYNGVGLSPNPTGGVQTLENIPNNIPDYFWWKDRFQWFFWSFYRIL